jgi:glucose/mannose transport system substrate-binding protein
MLFGGDRACLSTFGKEEGRRALFPRDAKSRSEGSAIDRLHLMSDFKMVGAADGASVPLSRDAHLDRSLRRLADAHREGLLKYLARLGVAASELEDAMQEVLIVFAQKLGELQPGKGRAFLFATADRIASNVRRGGWRRHRLSASLAEAPREPTPRPDDLTDELMRRPLLDAVLDRIPPDARLVFLLVELEEMTMAAVVQRLGLPEGTVASRLRRARACFDVSSVRVRASVSEGLRSPRRVPKKSPIACGKPSVDPEILSWWSQFGEADALGALLAVYKRSHPRHRSIRHTPLEGPKRVRSELWSRMLHGQPPDTFQMTGGQPLLSWVRRTTPREGMDPIDFLFGSEGWGHAFPSDVLDLVTHRGRIYAVPLDIHRTNSLFYNKRVFAENSLRPPTDLDDLDELAPILRRRGVWPLAMGNKEPWALTLLAFEVVLVAEAGADYYREFFAGRRSADDREILRTLTRVDRLLGYANSDAAQRGWDGALDLVLGGRAAMSIMGDWAKGYLISRGGRAEVDFGQTASPGGAGAFVFVTDVFGLPKRASHRGEAIELLKMFGSKEGQNTFNPIKGSIPARIDVDPSGYDYSSRASLHDFRGAPRLPSLTSLVPYAFNAALEKAMTAFARSHDPALVISAIRAHYDLLRS